jgi:hypothetical protein
MSAFLTFKSIKLFSLTKRFARALHECNGFASSWLAQNNSSRKCGEANRWRCALKKSMIAVFLESSKREL